MDRGGFKSNLPHIPHLPAPAPRRLRDPQGGPISEGSFSKGEFGASSPSHPSSFCAKQITSLWGASSARGNMAETGKVGGGVSAPPDSLWE